VHPAVGALPSGPDADTGAVLSFALWRQEFGGSRDAIGTRIQLGTDSYTIVAVAPADFHGVGTKPADVWLPLAVRARADYGEMWRGGYAVYLRVIARLGAGTDRARVNERATAAYRAAHTSPFGKSSTVVLGDLSATRAPGIASGSRVELLIGGVSLLVLLLTCGNVANILLIRGLRRGRELAIKTALGASRARLLREVMLEASRP
jgi:putative ABC transport system permease protein